MFLWHTKYLIYSFNVWRNYIDKSAKPWWLDKRGQTLTIKTRILTMSLSYQLRNTWFARMTSLNADCSKSKIKNIRKMPLGTIDSVYQLIVVWNAVHQRQNNIFPANPNWATFVLKSNGSRDRTHGCRSCATDEWKQDIEWKRRLRKIRLRADWSKVNSRQIYFTQKILFSSLYFAQLHPRGNR